jgi:Spy/CpxP family protein refolding chaperone
MNTDTSNKWRIRAATLSIFLLGAMAGAFALNAYNLWFGNKPPMNREARFTKMANELQLSTPQTSDVKQVFNETRDRMQALKQEDEPKVKVIREETDGKLQKILTPEQWQKFTQMREARKTEEKQREMR